MDGIRFNPQLKLLHQGSRVNYWLKKKRTWPVLVEVAPTGYCNARCPWCFFKGKQTTEAITPITMTNALIDMPRIGVKAINWTGGGEPTLHPLFVDFVLFAMACGLKQGLFTNAYQEIPEIVQSSLSWIRISLTDKGFDAIHRPVVPFGICLNHTKDYAEQQIYNLCKEARDFGAAYFQVRPALSDDYHDQDYLQPPDSINELATDNFKVDVSEYKYRDSVLPRSYRLCYGYHLCPSIDWAGRLATCLYRSGDEGYKLADLNQDRLVDVWKKVPLSVLATRHCQNCCKNHEINKALSGALELEDPEFL